MLAREKVKSLMTCPKFTIPDHALALVIANLREECSDKFQLWNSTIQKAVTHVAKVEGAVRNLADLMTTFHLT